MDIINNEFTKYRIYYQSAPQYNWQARVTLYNDNETPVGELHFKKEGVPIPANSFHFYPRSDISSPTLYFPASKFEELMNILRYEKPLFITLAPSNGIGTISTYDEPIGEEEQQ